MVYVKRTIQLKVGDRIAQFLLITYFKGKAAPKCKKEGFENTGKKVFWRNVIHDEKPKLKLQVKI